MPEITIADVRRFLIPLQGRVVDYKYLREEMRIDPNGKSWDNIRSIMFELASEKLVKPSGKRDGVFKVIKQVQSVKVYGRENNTGEFGLMFPKDFDTGMEWEIADYLVIRSGDLVLLAGVSNLGKTALSINFLAENVDKHRCVLMGNEFTTLDNKPTPRFLNRLKAADWVQWADEVGNDKFELLPVREDFEEHVRDGKVNIIDWINISSGEHYLISGMLERIKHGAGGGIAIAVIQKEESRELGRGAGYTRDFADVYLTIDKYGDFESRLTVGKVKESKGSIIGRSWAFRITEGVKLHDIREIAKCRVCYGKGWKKSGNTSIPCDDCNKTGYVDK